MQIKVKDFGTEGIKYLPKLIQIQYYAMKKQERLDFHAKHRTNKNQDLEDCTDIVCLEKKEESKEKSTSGSGSNSDDANDGKKYEKTW